ncbi:MAG: glucokinase [Hyphomicrobiaceae bacterium]|jgi:glucokinase
MGNTIGFDVGGRSVKGVLVDSDGAVLATTKQPTGFSTNLESLADALRISMTELGQTRIADGSLAKDSVAIPFGLGIAGSRTKEQLLRGSPNLPALCGHDVGAVVGAVLGRPAIVENDANCAATAEHWIGAAGGCPDFLMVALGTGVGSGLFLGNQLFQGSTGRGCELGHTIVERGGRLCGCGNRGCLEAYISETAVRARVRESTEQLESVVSVRARAQAQSQSQGQGQGQGQTDGWARALFDLAAEGEPRAEALACEMVEVLGGAIACAVNLFDLPTVVLGGGLARGVLGRLDDLNRGLASALFARRTGDVRIVGAALGPLAGAIGAARIAMPKRSPD